MQDEKDAPLFGVRVKELVEANVVADALPVPRALGIARQALATGFNQEASCQAVNGKLLHSSDAQLKEWDHLDGISKTMAILREGDHEIEYVAYSILRVCFQAAKNPDFLDTDEIPTLVGIAYGTGASVKRHLPQLAKKWIAGRAAV